MKYFPFSVMVVIALLGASAAASTAWAYERELVYQPERADQCGSGRGEHVCIRGEPDEAKLTRHCCYVNTYGHEVHAPAMKLDGTRPLRATVQCRDGYYSFSEHRSGTCSSHGGVQQWFRG